MDDHNFFHQKNYSARTEVKVRKVGRFGMNLTQVSRGPGRCVTSTAFAIISLLPVSNSSFILAEELTYGNLQAVEQYLAGRS